MQCLHGCQPRPDEACGSAGQLLTSMPACSASGRPKPSENPCKTSSARALRVACKAEQEMRLLGRAEPFWACSSRRQWTGEHPEWCMELMAFATSAVSDAQGVRGLWHQEDSDIWYDDRCMSWRLSINFIMHKAGGAAACTPCTQYASLQIGALAALSASVIICPCVPVCDGAGCHLLDQPGCNCRSWSSKWHPAPSKRQAGKLWEIGATGKPS